MFVNLVSPFEFVFEHSMTSQLSIGYKFTGLRLFTLRPDGL